MSNTNNKRSVKIIEEENTNELRYTQRRRIDKIIKTTKVKKFTSK